MLSLMYVSFSTLLPSQAASEVADIVAYSISRNATLDLTGALVFTGSSFAQALEGDSENVDLLMTSISRDQRHRNVTVIDRSPILKRRFVSWAMAYQGVSGYVSRPIKRLLEDKAEIKSRTDINRLYAIMREFGSG